MSQQNEWRVFCAVELPDAVRAGLEDHIVRLRKEVPDAAASWSRVDNIHLTLKFFGNVEVKRIQRISEAAERAVKEFSAFQIGVGETGVFPRASRPQVLWIGVNDSSGQLSALQEKFENECAVEGFAERGSRVSAALNDRASAQAGRRATIGRGSSWLCGSSRSR